MVEDTPSEGHGNIPGGGQPFGSGDLPVAELEGLFPGMPTSGGFSSSGGGFPMSGSGRGWVSKEGEASTSTDESKGEEEAKGKGKGKSGGAKSETARLYVKDAKNEGECDKTANKIQELLYLENNRGTAYLWCETSDASYDYEIDKFMYS